MSSQIHVAVPTPGTLEVIADNFGDFISTFSDRLSRDGVLIPEAPDLPRGSEVSLKFRLSDGFSLVEAVGLVSEAKARGLGVHFLVIQSGGELVDKVVSDHLSSGGQPFLVDSAAVATETPTAEVAPPPVPAPEPEPPDETDDPEDSVRDLLALDGKPAFAPGMVRLDGEGSQERAALTGLGSIDTQSKPLDGLGGESPMTQKIPIPAPEEVVFQTEGEAQSELEAAVSAMGPAQGENSQEAGVEPPAPASDSQPIPPTSSADEQDLAHLSEDEFASEIDSALDSAFGSEVDAALDAAFGPTDPSSAGSSNLVEPSGLGDAASEALDASTRMVRIPDLTEPEFGGSESPSVESSAALSSAASAAADLLGGANLGGDDDAGALASGGLNVSGSGADETSLEFPSDAELTPIPAPELEDLDLPEPLGVDPSLLAEPETETADKPLGDTPISRVDELELGSNGVDALEMPEDSATALAGDSASPEASLEGAPEDSSEAAHEANIEAGSTPSQLEMPSLDQYEDNDPYGFEEPAPSRFGSRSGLIPLLLLALIGVGAWQVTDLARKEFARLEPDPEVVARVTLEDEAELGDAAFDSLLSLGKQEDGPVVDLGDQVSLTSVTVLENVSWEAIDGGTRVVFAGNGAFSPMDTRVTRLEGDSPRIVLKIGGIQSPYSPDVLAVRTEQVAQLRFGFHLLPLRNEVHAVFDLTDPEAVLKEVKFAEGRLEVLIQQPALDP